MLLFLPDLQKQSIFIIKNVENMGMYMKEN